MDHSTDPTLNFNSDLSWSFTGAKMWDEFFFGVSKESAFIPILFLSMTLCSPQCFRVELMPGTDKRMNIAYIPITHVHSPSKRSD